MDVTPGPKLRRVIGHSQEALGRFDSDKEESRENPDLPQPDWQAWAIQFATLLREIVALVQS